MHILLTLARIKSGLKPSLSKKKNSREITFDLIVNNQQAVDLKMEIFLKKYNKFASL